jgi:cysteine desulfurase
MTERVYLDWNASAPLRPEARAAMARALDLVGNPSSVHAEGRRARALLDEAREQVARLAGTPARTVTFTSGGTEANVLALGPWVGPDRSSGPCAVLLVSAIEHPSVLAGGLFSDKEIQRLPVNSAGVIDLEVLDARLQDLAGTGIRPLVSVMLANNETGIIQPIRAVADRVHAAGGLLHVDAVQAAGRIVIDMEGLGADLLTLSAHKIGGPAGVGALIRRDEVLHLPRPPVRGGGQERGLRAGTENAAGIAGFGAAAAAAGQALRTESERLIRLRDRLEAGVLAVAPSATIIGAGAERVANTTLFAAPGLKAETAVIAFDLEGVAVSSGAACSSGKVQPSHVLAAMGLAPALTRGAIRVSLGWASKESDVERFLNAWRKLAGALLKESPGLAA